jgi:hypothetical protein
LTLGSREGWDFQSFRMRSFIFYGFETWKVNKTLLSNWSHLNEPGKGFRLKIFLIPAFAETGVTWADFSKR